MELFAAPPAITAIPPKTTLPFSSQNESSASDAPARTTSQLLGHLHEHQDDGPRDAEQRIDGTTGAILTNIPYVGGVDEVCFNPGDSRYYVAARDMPAVLGVIDAVGQQWLQNVPTNTNSHSLAVDSSNNRIFVPSQSGGLCGTQSADGCILVYGAQ